MKFQAALDGVAEMLIFARDDKFKQNALDTVKKINENTNCKATFYPLEDLDKLKERDAFILSFHKCHRCWNETARRNYLYS